MAWSLQAEICKLAQEDSLDLAFFKLEILDSVKSKFSLREDADWVRGGAETYIYRFWVKVDTKVEAGYILKACTAYSPVDSLSTILDAWVYRRRLLADLGVSTPRLYSYGNGLILEELVPHSFRDILAAEFKPASHLPDERLMHLAHYSAALYSLGFLSIAPFDDLRSRGTDCVVIDFGEDLGPAKGQPISSKEETFSLMITKLLKWNVQLDDRTKKEMYEIYDAFIDSATSRAYH
jgi:hypothetical protein